MNELTFQVPTSKSPHIFGSWVKIDTPVDINAGEEIFVLGVEASCNIPGNYVYELGIGPQPVHMVIRMAIAIRMMENEIEPKTAPVVSGWTIPLKIKDGYFWARASKAFDDDLVKILTISFPERSICIVSDQ